MRAWDCQQFVFQLFSMLVEHYNAAGPKDWAAGIPKEELNKYLSVQEMLSEMQPAPAEIWAG